MIEANLLVFARCIGFVIRAPGISNQAVPIPLRAGFALVLAIALSGAIPAGAGVHDGGSFLVASFLELLIGAAIGQAASVLYDGAAAGGKMLDDFVGTQVSNPQAEAAAGQGLGELWGMGFITVFFLAGGYQIVISALADGLTRIPPGSETHIAHLGEFGVSLGTLVMRTAALVAAPSLMLGFVVQLSLGAIARVIPRFSNFTLSFPVAFGAILLATIVTFPFIIPLATKPWLYLPIYER